jgi:hypothetical protein
VSSDGGNPILCTESNTEYFSGCWLFYRKNENLFQPMVHRMHSYSRASQYAWMGQGPSSAGVPAEQLGV